MKPYGIIYCHTNKVSGKVYIGQTTQTLERRCRKNDKTYNSYKTCILFFRALKKYGWEGFISTIIAEASDQTELTLLEDHFFKEYDSCNLKKGYNIALFSEGRGKQADSSKQKMSAKRTEYIQKHGHKVFGPPRGWHQFLEDGEYKQCTKCKQWKLLIAFGKYADTWDGLNRKCKDCHNEYRRQYKYVPLSDEDFQASYIGRQK